MPRLIFKNNFEVALAQPTTTSDTTITIRSGSGFPILGANERVVATIVDAATGLQFEIVTVTAVVGNVLTVQRAQEGTAARAWAAGDMLSIRTTAASLTNTVRDFGEIPSGINLNALTGSWFGFYQQPANASAQPSLNYPLAQAGSLQVVRTGVGPESCMQIYAPYFRNEEFVRKYKSDSGLWSDWVAIYNTASVVRVSNGGTGQTTIQGMKDAFGFGPVADQSIVPTSMGGTGSADNAQAWLNIRPQGSTPLAGDPVNDYDAATKRWVENLVNTGTVGPSMNGVMNYGVGDFHLRDSRAYIQPYEVVADGQLLNRADWPELWAYAQMLTPIADADWLADPLKRGKYSLGNGTTTFRVPDRNGAQTGSVRALFCRGDGGNSSNDGMIMESFVPNITGNINFHGSGPASEPASGTVVAGASGAFANGEGFNIPRYIRGVSLLNSGANSLGSVALRASNSSPAYGRNNLATDEVLPRNFTGVWVIRASGGFVAANTQWQVINGDAVRPGDGTVITGGNIVSVYKIGDGTEGSANMRLGGTIGGKYFARIAVANNTASTGSSFDFYEDGNFETPRGRGLVINDYGIGAQRAILPTVRNNALISDSDGASPWAPANGGGFQTTYAVNRICQFWVSQSGSNAYFRSNSSDNNPQRSKAALPWTTLQNAGTSDANVKNIGDDLDLNVALNNINSLEFKNFTYKNDESQTPRRGIIAQQAETIDPEYVHSAEASGVMTLDSNPLLLDALAAIKALSQKVESLTSEIAVLKAAK